jgi:hypothetical protein
MRLGFRCTTACCDIEELLTRPVGRPSHQPIVWYKGFLYQAASWKTSRRANGRGGQIMC